MKALLGILVAASFILGLGFGRQRAQTAPGPQREGGRAAEELLRELDAVRLPRNSMEYGPGADATERYTADLERGCRRIAALARELFERFPEHPRTPGALDKRWAVMSNTFDECDAVLAETDRLVAAPLSDELRDQVSQARAHAALLSERVPLERKLALAEAAFTRAPRDVRNALTLLELAQSHVADPQLARELARRALERFPEHQHVSPAARGLLRRLERVGEPFELAFDDFPSGARVSVADFRGRPLVVQVWDAHLQDSERLLAEVRALRARHPRLALVTIHNVRHADGPDALRALLAANEVDWPVFLDAVSPFETWAAREWSVTRLPTYFLVDAEGRLEAVSQRLGTLAPLVD